MATGYFLLDNATKIPQCGSRRRGGAKASGTIILHDAEGGTDLVGTDTGAESVANYIKNRTTYGSYHDLVDRDTHIPMAPIDYETWHSVPDNPWSVGISVAWNKADLARMSYAQRRSYYVPLARVVLLRVAEFKKRGIIVPINRMLTSAETQARKPGISTHSRTDPGRRSDPFGTNSVYEREFLTVLAELAGNTPPKEEDFMATLTDAEKKAMLSNIAEIETVVRRHEKDDEARRLADLKHQRASAAREVVLVQTVQALAAGAGIDEDRLIESLNATVREVLADPEFEIVLTPKETTP